MDFGITSFMSKVDSLGGLARKNKFTVEVTPPRTLVTDVEASTINFLAKGIGMPARTFGSTTYRSGGRFGLDVPYESTFEPVTITMQNTNNHAPRRFWENWFNHIQDPIFQIPIMLIESRSNIPHTNNGDRFETQYVRYQ